MGMQNLQPLEHPSEFAVRTTRELIHDQPFWHRHRAGEKDFTRQRKLPFMKVVVLVLQKTVRSIQLHLHDFFEALTPDFSPATAPSWSEARVKLHHTAFIELNQRAILDGAYGGRSLFIPRLWKGHRLLAIDSSLVGLPHEKKLGEKYGWVEKSNQKGKCGRSPQARLSVLTDVLNRLALHTCWVPWKQGERDLAIEHLAQMAENDLGLLDRGFASFELFAAFVQRQRGFVCRCPTHSFAIVNQLFAANKEGCSVTVQLRPCAGQRARLRRLGLPEEITVRFVTVRLSTGELEVLATNLLDEQRYPTEEFGPLYGHRWGIETYYGLLKNRLDLENFSGTTDAAVQQDVYATIFLSNLESILIQPAQEQLREKSPPLKNAQQVNHAVSFHTLKSQIIALLLSHDPIAEVLSKLEKLFLHNPVSIRPTRKVPRTERSAWRSYHYQRSKKKVVF